MSKHSAATANTDVSDPGDSKFQNAELREQESDEGAKEAGGQPEERP